MAIQSIVGAVPLNSLSNITKATINILDGNHTIKSVHNIAGCVLSISFTSTSTITILSTTRYIQVSNGSSLNVFGGTWVVVAGNPKLIYVTAQDSSTIIFSGSTIDLSQVTNASVVNTESQAAVGQYRLVGCNINTASSSKILSTSSASITTCYCDLVQVTGAVTGGIRGSSDKGIFFNTSVIGKLLLPY